MGKNEEVSVFVIRNGIMPDSEDPIHLDQFNNYFPGQMIYLSPLQTSLDGKLEAVLMDDFGYSKEKKEIWLTLKENVRYANGKTIKIADVAIVLISSKPRSSLLG